MLHSLSHKKIALLGLGVENTSLAKFFVKNGIREITICDQKERAQLEEKLQTIGSENFQFRFQCGREYLSNLENFDIVFRSPGMPLFQPELIAARKKDVEISSPMKLFFDLCPAKIIGVTGTKGKGTTASLIFSMLKRSGLHAFLAGNIGSSPFDFFETLDENSWVVLELSSFQLEDMEKSPHIAVVTNFFPEHLKPADPSNPNYHRSNFDYQEAKKNIFRFQTENDFFVANFDNPTTYEWGKTAPSKVFHFSRTQGLKTGAFIRGEEGDKKRELVLHPETSSHRFAGQACPISSIKLLGEHNLENILAASLASYFAKANPELFCQAIAEFEPLEHRIERVAEKNGVLYYNDSYSTTPEAASVAVQSFSQPIVLILGGASKGSDFTSLAELLIKRDVKAVVLIGEETERIKKTFQNAWAKQVDNGQRIPQILEGAKNMKEILEQANSAAQTGDVVLLSPGCASFGMFQNYKDRGKLFKEEVMRLIRD